jgi:hypothetical protein
MDQQGDQKRTEFDGFLALILLLLTPVSYWILYAFRGSFEFWFYWYGPTSGGIVLFALSIGFAISGLRQNNALARRFAIWTFCLIGLGWVLGVLLFPSISN